MRLTSTLATSALALSLAVPLTVVGAATTTTIASAATPACSMALNLGTGRGHSVLELVRAYETASGRAVPYRFEPRRPGDVAVAYADPAAAEAVLGWRAKLGLQRMCEDSWRWHLMNPGGFAD